MKIKNLTEEILLSLYSYRLTDLIIGTGNSMEYLIPGEINSIEPGHSYYINKRCIKSELAQYGWTPQEYFDILILHINDTDDRPKCDNPECNIPLNWGGRIYYGYSQNGYSWFDRIQHYCSPSCRSKVVSTNVNLYTNFGFKDFSKLNIAQRNNFIKLGNEYDICQMYLCEVGDLFKFGISYDLENRFGWYSPDTYIIYESTRVNVAYLEYYIKELYGTSKEYITDLNDFRLKFIQSLIILKS